MFLYRDLNGRWYVCITGIEMCTLRDKRDFIVTENP